MHAPGWNHWEALGLPWDAPAERAKAAYLDLVKVFHPDRYAGKRLRLSLNTKLCMKQVNARYRVDVSAGTTITDAIRQPCPE